MYINTHSYFSLRYGTFSIDSLVAEAIDKKIQTLALTDINNTSGMIDFVKTCRENDIRPMGGIEFRDGNEYLYTGIAKNNEGLRELNEFLSYYNLNKTKLPSYKNSLLDQFSIHHLLRFSLKHFFQSQIIVFCFLVCLF